MERFEVKGVFRIKGKLFKFSKQVEAGNENRAKEIIFSLFGSRHRVKRRHIEIEEIKKAEEKGV